MSITGSSRDELAFLCLGRPDWCLRPPWDDYHHYLTAVLTMHIMPTVPTVPTVPIMSNMPTMPTTPFMIDLHPFASARAAG